MEHAPKIFLVDSRFDLKNESRHHSALDRAISSVLNADLPEREKHLQYELALHPNRTNLKNIKAASNEPVKVATDRRREEYQGQDYRNSCDGR